MPSLSSEHVRRSWQYDVVKDFHKLDLFGFLPRTAGEAEVSPNSGKNVSKFQGHASGPKNTAKLGSVLDEAGQCIDAGQLKSAEWATSSPHIFEQCLDAPSDHTACTRYIPFQRTYDSWSQYSVNAAHDFLAISVPACEPSGENDGADHGPTVEVYDLSEEGRDKQVLRGHRGRIDCVLFSPTNPNLLVTSSEPRGPYSSDGIASEIVFWDLSANSSASISPGTPVEENLECAVGLALDTLKTSLAQEGLTGGDNPVGLILTDAELLKVRKTTLAFVRNVAASRRIADLPKLHGRLARNFHSPGFSPDGTKLLYMPGDRPESNGSDDRWLVHVYDVNKKETIAELKGHEDAIMWTGFSPSGRLALTVCWDRTVRLWDSSDGREIWNWKTKQQNWTGCFAPLGATPSSDNGGEPAWVAATCGTGTVYCWSSIDGSTLWTYDQGPHWCRAISVSPDGRFVAVGGEDGGKIGIVDLTAAVVNGRHTACMERKLGIGGVHVKLDPDEEDEEDAERKRRSQRHAQAMVLHMIACHTVRFLPAYSDAIAADTLELKPASAHETRGYRLGYSNSVDSGVEIYDMVTNRKWRCEPLKVPQHEETTETAGPRRAQRSQRKPDARGLIGWEFIPGPRSNGEDEGQVFTVHGDGVRLWDVRW